MKCLQYIYTTIEDITWMEKPLTAVPHELL